MYTREILAPRASPIEDGNPLTGTWDRAFEKVDLLEIRKPYGCPMPRWVRDWRIKEWQNFHVQDDRYLLEATFSNFKLYRMAQIVVYDKENGEKLIFRKIKAGSQQYSKSLSNSSIDNHSSHFYFRIHSWLDVDTIKLDINIEAVRKRPPLTVHLAYNLSRQDVTPMAVSLGVAERRVICAYKALAPVRGDMVFGKQSIKMKQDNCSGFFCDYRGFYPYKTRTTICSGMGFSETQISVNGDAESNSSTEEKSKKKRFGFHIAENLTREPNKNNENALWVDGILTPLPPVLITMSNGPDDIWVIQDVEGMVDLTFTPKEQNKSGINMFFSKTEYNAPLGYYNGMLVSSKGEQIQIKNLFGTGKIINLRV